MLSSSHRATLFAADEAARVAIAVAQTNAEGTGFFGDEAMNLAAVETARRSYQKARARLGELLERETYATDVEVNALVDWYATVSRFDELNEAVRLSTVGAAVTETAAATGAQLANPAAWPSWLKWGTGTVVLALVAVALAPAILAAILRSLFGGRK